MPTAGRTVRGLKSASARRRITKLRTQIVGDGDALREFGAQSGKELTGFTDAVLSLDAGLSAVSAQATGLNLALQDHDDDKALSSAFDLFKKSVDLAHSGIGIALTQEEEMEHIEGKLLEHRKRFSKNSLMFRVLLIGLRAEASRLDAENQSIFISVAAEMSRMEKQMNAGVEAAFTELDEIVREAASGRKVLQGLCDNLHVVAQKSIQHIRTQLDALKERLRPCAAASGSICELLALTRSQTSDLITALQYQDIVQQQLQHVDQGFRDMATHLDTRGSDVAFIRTAARVQREHLRSSRTAIEGAGRQIGEATEALMGTGSRLVLEFVQMQRVADLVFSEAGISDLFGRETQKLIEIASSSEVTNERIAKLLERIEASVRLFSTDICRHEFEVQLVALNAQVASAQVAEAHALNKLAEETAVVASDTSELIQLMRRELAETLQGLLRMRKEASEIQVTIAKERSELAEGSLAVAAKLSKLEEKIRQGSSGVSDGFTKAYDHVQTLVYGLGFTHKIEPAFTPAQATCEIIILATEGCIGAGGPTDNRLSDHEKRYTMQSEREAHAAAMGPATVAASPAPATNDLGLELFEVPPAESPAAAPEVTPAPASASAEGSVELF